MSDVASVTNSLRKSLLSILFAGGVHLTSATAQAPQTPNPSLFNLEANRAEYLSLLNRARIILEIQGENSAVMIKNRDLFSHLIGTRVNNAEDIVEWFRISLRMRAVEELRIGVIELDRLSNELYLQQALVHSSPGDAGLARVLAETSQRRFNLLTDLSRRAESSGVNKFLASVHRESPAQLVDPAYNFAWASSRLGASNEFSTLNAQLFASSNLVPQFADRRRFISPSVSLDSQIDASVILERLLPWPPPPPSAYVKIDKAMFPCQACTLGVIDDQLRSALLAAGYDSFSYYGVPGGFALITRIEQIDNNGLTLSGQDRWSVEVRARTLSDMFKALIFAPIGHFRIIAFIISSVPVTFDQYNAKLADIEKWSSSGSSRLPDDFRSNLFTDSHEVEVMIYEFSKSTNNAPPVTIPGRWTTHIHLSHTKFIDYMR